MKTIVIGVQGGLVTGASSNFDASDIEIIVLDYDTQDDDDVIYAILEPENYPDMESSFTFQDHVPKHDNEFVNIVTDAIMND